MSNKIDPAPSITNERYIDWPEINRNLQSTFDDENNSETIMYISKLTLVPSVEEVKTELLQAGYDIFDENDQLLSIRLKK